MTSPNGAAVVVHDARSALAVSNGQDFWNDKQVAALRQLGVKDASNGDLAVFLHQCQRTGLDPFVKQIYMLSRWTKDGVKQTIQTGIDGYRLIARRSADQRAETLEYEDTLWCGKDGKWADVWLATSHPAAAKVTVLRNGKRFSAVALWDEFVQTNKDGAPLAMWQRMGANQLAKCAEAAALRKAFPQDLSGIYTDDEMGQAEAAEVVAAQPPPPVKGLRARAASAVTPPSNEAPTEPVEPPKAKRAKSSTKPAEPDSAVPAEADPWAPRPITDGQRTKLHAGMNDLGIADREQKLSYIAGVIGRTVASSNDLTVEEASQVIECLARDAEPAPVPASRADDEPPF